MQNSHDTAKYHRFHSKPSGSTCLILLAQDTEPQNAPNYDDSLTSVVSVLVYCQCR